jgi:hypothetical protein
MNLSGVVLHEKHAVATWNLINPAEFISTQTKPKEGFFKIAGRRSFLIHTESQSAALQTREIWNC